uniref:Major facilitator superfamily (MFS) profile domain-containing protein n=1 Tax=Plectus sambesii TaxID=2011161 RepID=A0A914VMU1_9BILA
MSQVPAENGCREAERVAPAMSAYDQVQELIGNFGRYQLILFLATQLGYLAITGSMLCTTFDTALPKGFNCTGATQADIVNATAKYWLMMDFRSLLLEWHLLCSDSLVPTFFSTAVMLGGVLGAVFCGFVADRFGRKPVVIGTMAGVAAFNFLIAGVGAMSWTLTSTLFFALGFCGGGYMVTNMVLALEAVGTQYWRLFVVAFNGWPLGMMFMAAVGYLTHHWRWFHVTLGAVAVLVLVPLTAVSKESARWLLQHERLEESDAVLAQVARMNGKAAVSLRQTAGSDTFPTLSSAKRPDRSYSYMDLMKHKSIYVPLLALSYSWLASSVLSFAIYFNLDSLPGDRFVKMLLTGLFKGMAGTIPFFLNHCVGRRPIFLVSVAVTCVTCWTVVAIDTFSGEPGNILLTVFSIMGASAIDPMWKVNHLYSTELFPTVVRNMARAVCNIGSRLGSVIAPSISHLRHYNLSWPYMIFGCLMLVQVAVGALYLPETKNRDLPDRLPDDVDDSDCTADVGAVGLNSRDSATA